MAEMTHDNAGDQNPEQQNEQQEGSAPSSDINVGKSERLGSVLGGSLLTLLGLRRRSNFGALLMLVGGGLIYRGVTGHCQISAMMGRNTAQGGEPPDASEYFEHGIHVEEVISVQKSPEELYQFWRNLENLPQFMDHLDSVKKIDEKKSHWVAKAPAGLSVEWDAEIINDEPNSLIAWRSLGGADVDNAGSVRFVGGPNGRGTEVRVVMDYLPPAGKVGNWIAKLFGDDPQQTVRADLRHFKQVMEVGEALTTEGQSSGR